MQIRWHALRWGLIAMLTASAALGQSRDELRQTLFGPVEAKFATARTENAPMLAPNTFERANSRYEEAVRNFEKGKSLRELEAQIGEASRLVDQAVQIAKLAQATFATTLKAREDALKANAPTYATEEFEKAESRFRSATRELESGDAKDAKKRVPEMDALFRRAELIAIKASIIGTVRNLILEARREKADEFAPITFANAQKLLNEAEAILNSNRRSETSAKEKAEAAALEARHAIFLTRQMKRLRKNPDEWENYVLDTETLIHQIGGIVGFQPEFDEGLAKPLKQLYRITQTLQEEKQALLAEIEDKNNEIARLQQELLRYQEKERGLQAELREKQYKLELKRQRDEKIRSIQTLFSEEEGVVLLRGNSVIIRLIGLTFPSGRATIEPEFFSLLTKVQRAIRKFPNAAITIEGHTDSRGNDEFNQNLSYERAQAVRQYLLANMGLDESRIAAIGYGESRPIASNETSAGRAQNRRIDVIITFSEETL